MAQCKTIEFEGQKIDLDNKLATIDKYKIIDVTYRLFSAENELPKFKFKIIVED